MELKWGYGVIGLRISLCPLSLSPFILFSFFFFFFPEKIVNETMKIMKATTTENIE